jgi:predicted DNA-binding transcriptional regulator AlpA
MNDLIKEIEDRLLRQKDAAAILACSLRTVDRLASSGRLRRVICGGVRFRESEVLAIVNGGAQ